MSDKNKNRISIRLCNDTIFHCHVRNSKRTIENPTIQVSMPQPEKALSIPSPQKHLVIFVNDKEEIVCLVSDETKPEHTQERHIFRRAIPLETLMSDMAEIENLFIPYVRMHYEIT